MFRVEKGGGGGDVDGGGEGFDDFWVRKSGVGFVRIWWFDVVFRLGLCDDNI